MKKTAIIVALIIIMILVVIAGLRFLRKDASFKNIPVANFQPAKDLGECTVVGFAKSTEVYKQVAGVDPNLLSLDIYVPKTRGNCDSKYPLMVYVHGGGWQNGDKAGQIKSKSEYFTKMGYVFVSVNYRLTPAVLYPTHNQDVAAAIKWLSVNVAKYSALNNNMTIMGHSAGGGIIAALATDEKYLNEAGLPLNTLKCAVDLDAAGYNVSEKGDKEMFYMAFGDDPAVWQEASPINHIAVNKGIPSFFMVTRGEKYKQDKDKLFRQKLDEANIPTVHLLTNLDHNGVNAAVGNPQDALITPRLQEFLNTQCK